MILSAWLFLLGPPALAQERPLPTAELARVSAGSVNAAGSVDQYIALALEQSPEVSAAFYRWESAVQRVARARTLPEPTIKFGAFLRSVETRVGPQQARISVEQAFPWPTKLTAGGDGASAEARAAEAMLEATSLVVAERVAVAYWSLWEVRRTRSLHREHLGILDGLSQAVRARLAVGGATLADLQQVDLSRARLADAIESMDEKERAMHAALVVALGDREAMDLPTTTEPELALPSDAELHAKTLRHPNLIALDERAEAADARARAVGANRLPSFTLGGDWIVTGQAAMPDTPETGKDAVMVGLGVRVPLWQATYAHDVSAERAVADARRSERRAQGDQLLGELERILAELRDSERRVRVLSGTLLPQADAAYQSVLGNYAVGQSTVAQTLLGQRDLLDLAVDRANASADHQRAWARLDQLVGTEVSRTVVPHFKENP